MTMMPAASSELSVVKFTKCGGDAKAGARKQVEGPAKPKEAPQLDKVYYYIINHSNKLYALSIFNSPKFLPPVPGAYYLCILCKSSFHHVIIFVPESVQVAVLFPQRSR
jgi:hypothetical protein